MAPLLPIQRPGSTAAQTTPGDTLATTPVVREVTAVRPDPPPTRAQLARARGALESLRRHRLSAAELPPPRTSNPAASRSRPMAQVPELGRVQAGSFRVGQTEIRLEPAEDSLDDVVDRINDGAMPPVIARLDPETLVLSITRKDPRAELVIGDDTSGFFRSVRMTPATYQAVDAVVRPRPLFHDVGGLRRDVFELRRALDAIMSASFGDAAADAAAREQVRQSVAAALAAEAPPATAAPEPASRFGFGLEASEGGSSLSIDAARFERAARQDVAGLHAFLFGDGAPGSAGGFVGRLVAGVETAQRSGAAPDGPGRLIDLFA